MREAIKDNVLLVGKTLVFSLGGLLFLAALVDLVVTGPTWRGAAVLLVGILLAGVPLALAFRDALRHARKRS